MGDGWPREPSYEPEDDPCTCDTDPEWIWDYEERFWFCNGCGATQ